MPFDSNEKEFELESLKNIVDEYKTAKSQPKNRILK